MCIRDRSLHIARRSSSKEITTQEREIFAQKKVRKSFNPRESSTFSTFRENSRDSVLYYNTNTSNTQFTYPNKLAESQSSLTASVKPVGPLQIPHMSSALEFSVGYDDSTRRMVDSLNYLTSAPADPFKKRVSILTENPPERN
eukprot:TRINITY_DN3268_c0_g1_i34.p1 TRINITY_DN3268_c0_g1~~TRINITY_DN3268_c0_g1_i34.p1  ORF type:complete len:143 (+),score=28.93 TRINITY_DN3268_c0_g1_i34:65-493(+)